MKTIMVTNKTKLSIVTFVLLFFPALSVIFLSDFMSGKDPVFWQIIIAGYWLLGALTMYILEQMRKTGV
jgi:hypothetical protein